MPWTEEGKYICPFCQLEMEDGIVVLNKHREPGGECDQLMEAHDTEGMI